MTITRNMWKLRERPGDMFPYASPPRGLQTSTVGLRPERHLRTSRDHKPITCCRSQARDAAYPCAGMRWSAQ